jgi:hypothetical protein
MIDRNVSLHPSSSSPVDVFSLAGSMNENLELHDEELARDIQNGRKCFGGQ